MGQVMNLDGSYRITGSRSNAPPPQWPSPPTLTMNTTSKYSKKRRPSLSYSKNISPRQVDVTSFLEETIVAIQACSAKMKRAQSLPPTPTRAAPPPPRARRVSLSERSFNIPQTPSPEAEAKKPKSHARVVVGESLWTALKASGTPLLSETLNFNVLGTATHWDGTTLTPSLLRQGLDIPDAEYHIYAGIQQALYEWDGMHDAPWLVSAAMEHYMVGLAEAMCDRVSGKHVTFLDPRLYNMGEYMVQQALRLMNRLEARGIDRGRVVFSIPATEAGIRAAQELESSHSIQTNLILVSGLQHAAVCAGAGASMLTFHHREIADAHKVLGKYKGTQFDGTTYPAVLDMHCTAEYFKLHGVKTKLAVTHLSAIGDIPPLQGVGSLVLKGRQSKQLPRETLRIGLENMCGDVELVFQTIKGFVEDKLQMMGMDADSLISHYAEDLGEWYTQKAESEMNSGKQVGYKSALRDDHVGFRMFFTLWDAAARIQDDTQEKPHDNRTQRSADSDQPGNAEMAARGPAVGRQARSSSAPEFQNSESVVKIERADESEEGLPVDPEE
ncbi:Transaldolase [Grifola frondosa]|uniref:Transaldolase n=1 Tax=Grifola frondosa TaxID=5627 RepID=A0A1C7MI87_GRIFR|nr:Transaldolase [Grifola frondosa]